MLALANSESCIYETAPGYLQGWGGVWRLLSPPFLSDLTQIRHKIAVAVAFPCIFVYISHRHRTMLCENYH